MQALSSRLRDLHVKRIIRDPGSVSLVLRTWEPEMEGSAEFLQLLTGKMPVKWWLRRNPAVRMEILSELIRIDGGRKVIADWLASVIREETDLSVLKVAAGWESRKYGFTEGLLDAWHDRSLEGSSNTAAIRGKALKVIVGAILPSGTSSENAGRSPWNEEQRAKIILKNLSECLDTGHAMAWLEMDRLEILSCWEPPLELHGKEVLSEIFCGWERHMQNIAGIMAENEEKPYGDWCDMLRKYLQMTWRGLVNLSSSCADTSGRLLSWIEYWLPHGRMVTPRIIEEMCRWNPSDDTLQEDVAALWSRYLLSPHGCGYENPAVWRAVGRYFAECKSTGFKMEEICRNCLKAVGLFSNIKDELREKLMKTAVYGPWLTWEQQAEAELKKLWAGMMKLSPGEVMQLTIRHLMGLLPYGVDNPNAIKNPVLKRLESLNESKAPEIIHGLMHGIGQWEGNRSYPGEMFYHLWGQLRQCRWWEDPVIRRDAAEALAVYLKINLVQGMACQEMESLWLETLCNEDNFHVIEALLKEQSEIMKICPGFCPDSLPVWKALGQDEDPEIRKAVWRFFIALEEILENEENETGLFLVRQLQEERDLGVLQVMADWKPAAGRPLPPGFWKGWADCLQGLTTDTFRSFVTGKINDYALKVRLEEIICVPRSVTGNFAIAWFEEQFTLNSQSAELADLQVFWKTLTETMNSFTETINALAVFYSYSPHERLRNIQSNLDTLFHLGDDPSEFLNSFEKVDICGGDRVWWNDLWYGLFKKSGNRDVSSLTVNARHNLGVITASGLGVLQRVPQAALPLVKYVRSEEWKRQFFVKLCGDGTWTPNRIPAGWERFCHEFRRICRETGWKGDKTGKTEKICQMVRIGHTIGDERCHELFRQTLCQVLRSGSSEVMSVIDSALWCEVTMAAERAERLSPDGLDEAGQRRWLRQFIRSHEQTLVGDEGSEATRAFWNSLWTSLHSGRQKGVEEAPAVYNRELVFFHPHRDRDANQGGKPCDRLIETDTGRGQHPVLFPAG